MANVCCRMQALFCLCFALFIAVANSFLDLEELKNVHYEIDISDKPVLIGRPIEQEVLYLASKYGQRYECQLPDMTDYEKEQEEEKVASEVGISELLKPMETAPCLIKTKDWWTYEFCYSRHIRQYHVESGKEEGVKFLGHYESEMDWSNKTHKDAKRHKLNRYHSHSYVNGTECDITGKPREAEVRFLCAEGHGDSIDRIDEPSSCSYILTIYTTRICHHPFLRPPPSLKPKPVLCFPALEQDQFEQYTQIQEEKERQKQETIKRLKDKMKAAQKLSIGDDAGVDEDEDPDEDSDGLEDGKVDDDEVMVEEISLDGMNVDDADDLQKMMKAVLKSVQNAIKSVDDEVQDTTEPSKTGKTKEKSTEGDVDDDDEEEDEDDDETKLLLDDEDEELGFSKEELEEYMNKPYAELMKEFKEGIGEMTDDPAEAARLNTLAQQLESSFENLEAMDDVIEDVSDQLSSSGTLDDKGTKHLVEMLSKLIREVLNGPQLKEYMKTYGLYLSTLLKDFRESIDELTDDPDEIKRLNGLADELEKTVRELEELEEEEVIGETGEDTEEDEGKVDIIEEDTKSEENFVENLKKLIKEAKESKSSLKKPKLPTSSADDEKVRVRVTRIKLDKNNKNKINLDEDAEDIQVYDSNHRKIEESVQQHLENAGVNVGAGGKVEFRILTYSPDEWPDGEGEGDFTILSEDDSLYFKNMIVSLLGSDAEVKEQTRQNRLESNYHFMWGEESQGSTHHQVTGEEVVGQEVTEATEDVQDSDNI